ncbi:ABC transporter permease [Billgrantia endophytica]|uniref:ABC transporter permease n=1 Tax=Billgrantia endophytica TaxID=2033802 RepID=A0A2N7UAD9_9GAMM|nr:ABC transporter permease [Halomonas endophytica]PMR77380.1 ABC transporter permease [Halomonas endophytica]
MSLNPRPRPPLSEAALSSPLETSERQPIEATPAAATPSGVALGASRRLLPENWDRYLVRIGALLVAALCWHLASTYGFDFFVRFDNVPGPLVVGAEFLAQASSQQFYLHILHSIQRIAIAYGLAVVIGVVLGVMMGRSRFAEDVILPYIEILRPIPAVAWIPLAILMMPTEQSSIVFITFLGALFPIVINTVHGVEQTPKVLVRAARSLGASNAAILWHVVLPGALPSIVTGLAIGMGVAWFSLLAGEIISGQYGIGYFTWSAYTLVEYPKIIIGMLVIGGLGSLCTLLVRKACAPLLRWQTEGAKS